MKVAVAVAVALVVSGGALASPIFTSECPLPTVQEQRVFWDRMAKGAGFNDTIDELKIGCFVVTPAVDESEFKACSFVATLLAAFHESVMPWSKNGGSVNIIKARVTGQNKFEFVEVLYSEKTGNMIILRVKMTRPSGSNNHTQFSHYSIYGG